MKSVEYVDEESISNINETDGAKRHLIRLPRKVFDFITENNRKRPRPSSADSESSEEALPAISGTSKFRLERENDLNKYLFCSTRKTSIRRNKVPMLALIKGLHFPNKIACIDQLTRLEERLVSPRHVFQSIWPHKGLNGQYKTKGGIVNVPVNVDTGVSCLPRNFDATGIIHVSLARKLISTKDYIKGNVSPLKVWEAAEYLQTTPLYMEYDVQLADQDAWNTTHVTPGSYDEANGECLDTTENAAEDENEEKPLNAGTSESILISDNDITIRLAPGEGRTLISVLMDKDSDFLSFPKVYYGHKLEGSKTISYSALTKSVARRFDRRAAKRPDLFCFVFTKINVVVILNFCC